MKRSSNIGLVVMGAAAFTATFAGASAFMAWRKPAQPQPCTQSPDGTQACTSSRSSTGVARYVNGTFFYGSSAKAAPAAGIADSSAALRPATRPPAALADGTTRRGFGSSAKLAFRGSAGG